MSIWRPVCGALAYLMTFFASPVFWWFGGGMLTTMTMRWSLVGAIVMMVANFATWNSRPKLEKADKWFLLLLFFSAINAFIVNLLLANYPEESNKVFDILWKSCLTSALVFLSIRDRKDLDLFLFGIVLACGFIGYQIVLGGQGSVEGGRLEGFSFPGAQGANGGAAVLSLGLPLAGYFVISMHNRIYAVASLVSVPLILETVLRCNSRGAYLGLIGAGVVIILLARGKSKIRAIGLCILGSLAIFLMASNTAIWDRFYSIFVDAEKRDGSASERLLYWQAALQMIADHPFGSGGEAAFTSPLGVTYIQHFRPEFRSVHNGPLDIAAGWGIQGLLFLTVLLVNSARIGFQTIKKAVNLDFAEQSLLGAVLMAVLVNQLTCSMFTSVLDGEWFLWIAACLLIQYRCVDYDAENLLDFDENEDGDVE